MLSILTSESQGGRLRFLLTPVGGTEASALFTLGLSSASFGSDTVDVTAQSSSRDSGSPWPDKSPFVFAVVGSSVAATTCVVSLSESIGISMDFLGSSLSSRVQLLGTSEL